MVWEASQKGVPFLGVPGDSLKTMILMRMQFLRDVNPNLKKSGFKNMQKPHVFATVI